MREGLLSVSVNFAASSLPSIPFDSYNCSNGWRGVDVSEQFITDILTEEYKQQKPYLYGMLKRVFGWYSLSRKIAKKKELQTGVVWSYCVQNEFWETVSWVMVDSDSDNVLENCYSGLAKRYEIAKVEKATIRWVDRWCCSSPSTLSTFESESTTTNEDDENWNTWLDKEEITSVDRSHPSALPHSNTTTSTAGATSTLHTSCVYHSQRLTRSMFVYSTNAV